MTASNRPPPRVLYGLAGAADVSLETVKRRLAGLPIRPSTAARLDAAAQRLGVTLPPLASAPGRGGQLRPAEAAGAPPTPTPQAATTPPPSKP